MPNVRVKDLLEIKPSYSYDLTCDESDVPEGKIIKFFFQLTSKPDVVAFKMEGELFLDGSKGDIDQLLAPKKGNVPPATQIILSESLGIAVSLTQILGLPRPRIPLALKEASQ